MARKDIHRPSAIIPGDYDFVCAFSFSEVALAPGVLDAERATLDRHMALTGGQRSTHEHGGACHVCGAWMIDYAIFYHAPTNSYIETGFDCAEKMDFHDTNLFKSVRDRRIAATQAKAGKLKAEGMIEAMGLSLDTARLVFQADSFAHIANDELIEKYRSINGFSPTVIAACDIIRALVKWGAISDKQWTYLASCFSRVENAATELANREAAAAEKEANGKPAPEGKLVVQGKIISAKVQENQYGVEYKMLVEHADGWRVWVTVPAALGDVEKDWVVEFTATLKQSQNDKFFAYGSRPSKASIISKEII